MEPHRRINGWLIAPVVALLVASAAGAIWSSATPVAGAQRIPPADALEIMTTMVVPASDTLFNVWAEPPVTEEEWAAIRTSAAILAESGNLLMRDRRAGDREWLRLTQELVAAAMFALRAAEARSVDASIEAGDLVLEVCASCHSRYVDEWMPGPASSPTVLAALTAGSRLQAARR